MIIDGVEYRKVEPGEDIRIVILQRGWCMVGYFKRDGADCTLEKASVIRSWGTKNGLGEISEGPTSKTRLDPCKGTVNFDYLTVVATIKCDAEKWKNAL